MERLPDHSSQRPGFTPQIPILEQVDALVADNRASEAVQLLVEHLKLNGQEQAAFCKLGTILQEHIEILLKSPLNKELPACAKHAKELADNAEGVDEKKALLFTAHYLSPSCRLGNYCVGSQLNKKELFEQSLPLLTHVSVEDAHDPYCTLELGRALAFTGNLDAAEQAFRLAASSFDSAKTGFGTVKISRGSIVSRYNLSLVLVKKERIPEAIDQLFRIASQNYMPAHEQLGLLLPALITTNLDDERIRAICGQTIYHARMAMHEGGPSNAIDDTLQIIRNLVEKVYVYEEAPFVHRHLLLFAVGEFKTLAAHNPQVVSAIQSDPVVSSFREHAIHSFREFAMLDFALGYLERAENLMKNILFLDPKNLLANALMTSILIKKNSPEQALPYIDCVKSLMVLPSADILYDSCICHILLQNWPEVTNVCLELAKPCFAFEEHSWPKEIPQAALAVLQNKPGPETLELCTRCAALPDCPLQALRATCLLLAKHCQMRQDQVNTKFFFDMSHNEEPNAAQILQQIEKIKHTLG